MERVSDKAGRDRDQDGVKVMSLIELVLVKKDILGSVQDVRGLG